MEKLKSLTETYSRWKDLRKYVDRIDTYLTSDFEVAIGSAKSLIESICKTILDEQKVEISDEAKIKKLVNETLKSLNIKRDEVCHFTSGIITASQNLATLRNKLDTSSHGQSLLTIENNPMEELTIYFLINSVEVIACFLIEFYEIEYPLNKKSKEHCYEDYDEFNKWLDNEYGMITVTEYPISTSLALFTDPIAYKEKYQEYLSLKNGKTN